MPLDNISPDANGDLYVAGIPMLGQAAKSFSEPWKQISPVTVWRISRAGDAAVPGGAGYKLEKVIEDKESKVLSGTTTVRHDVKTGRLFMGGKCMLECACVCANLMCSCDQSLPHGV